jgi:DNA-binding transcriptional ArsR family regulator
VALRSSDGVGVDPSLDLRSPEYFSPDLTIVASATILKSMLNYSEIDSILRALVEPTRRQILERLSRGPATVSQLAEPFGMTFAAVLQHLQVLEACGLIRSEKIGRVRTCRIEPGGLAPLADWITERRIPAERHLDRLGEILAETDQPSPKVQDQEKDEQT